MRFDRRHIATASVPVLLALVASAGAADLPTVHQAARHRAVTRLVPSRLAAVRSVPPRRVEVAPAVLAAAPEVGAARAAVPSPTALSLPGAAGVPAFVDLSPVFTAQRACGPGFSPDAPQLCRRHGELRVDCDPSGRDCVPLPPDSFPYGSGAAARLAY